MQLNQNDLQSLPFPYFYVDQHQQIIARSNITKHLFPYKTNFLSLIATDFHIKVKGFLADVQSKSAVSIPFFHLHEKQAFYYVYKLYDEQKNVHLFCFYPEKEMKEFTASATHLASVGKLAAGIAHEIRNPLTTMKGFIQLLKPHLQEIGKEYYAHIVLEEINRANDMIDEFLNTAKPQTNKRQQVNLATLLKDIYILHESEAILKNIHFTLSSLNDDIIIEANVKQMKQVFMNIIKNAMEAMVENKLTVTTRRINIVAQQRNSRAIISIIDNGGGMNNETMANLFLPFFTTKEKGTGLGLSICKKIIEDHHGTIEIDSVLGEGTTFTISFPIYRHEC